MICPLCNEREGNKKNTHYLTDGIIRQCLNLDGGNGREKGFYFDMSHPGFVEMGFQRETDSEALRKELGREPNDQEIENAKKNPYSTDNVFCKQCEDLFTKIETDFQAVELPKFRGAKLTGMTNVELANIKLSRLFWLIQVWRSAVCVPALKISPTLMERMRLLILNHTTASTNELSDFHMSVSFLETTGKPEEMTRNLVGFMKRDNMLAIFMCDFVIQYSYDPDDIKYDELFGLNEPDFKNFINYQEDKFKIKVISNQKRNEFISKYHGEQVKLKNQHYSSSLAKIWKTLFNRTVPPDVVAKFLKEIADNKDEDVLHYSKENIMKITMAFINDNMPNRLGPSDD